MNHEALQRKWGGIRMAASPMALSDEQLVALHRSAEGEAGAGEHANELFGRYSQRVAVWCVRFTRDRETARDLAQDVLLKAYHHLGAFRSDAKFSTWLYSITRNHCMNHIRQLAVHPAGASDLTENDLVDQGKWDTLAELQRQHMIETVRQLVIDNLDQTEAQVMMLHFGEEIPVATVTEMLGLKNASGAKAFVVSAKRKLGAAWRRMQARQAGAPRRPQ